MILSKDGYALIYDNKLNRIYIDLPQTPETLISTGNPLTDRRTDVKETDLTILLNLARLIFMKGVGNEHTD